MWGGCYLRVGCFLLSHGSRFPEVPTIRLVRVSILVGRTLNAGYVCFLLGRARRADLSRFVRLTYSKSASQLVGEQHLPTHSSRKY